MMYEKYRQKGMDTTHAIRRCLGGDKAAYEEVVAEHGDRLVMVLSKILGDIEDARDIAQETFVRAYLNLHKYDANRPFEPWLYRIARNLAYNLLKAQGRRKSGPLGMGEEKNVENMESETKSPILVVLDSERRTSIDKVLSRMRFEFREILTLRYMERLEYEEIATRMRIPIGTVKTWLSRAKSQFRKLAEGSDIF